ncbi:MAG: hypothetical protein EHM20_08055 [Alphaproteobacteria bacterium]|nr:MAG: hypothetical protein EHM20_08055 [Alphaproteobacteria bacterium]
MKLQHSAIATATHRKPEQFRAILGAFSAPKAGVSKHWPFDTHVDPTFLTGFIFNAGNSTKLTAETRFPESLQEISIKHHIDPVKQFQALKCLKSQSRMYFAF